MARRLSQTTADYIVIALSPALVMTLVGSLVFFLLAVFYQGQFTGRLHWVMTCFVFGAVLIARIAIEDGFERAMPFGIALALAVGVAANRFMEIQGTWIDSFSWAINWSLIALIWWCAHQLTWDCTVIDDSQDSSGEGLLQITGLERAPAAGDASQADKRLEGTTSRDVPATWWQRYVEHQRRPHAPGVWVVYFSLAALPLFGVGQWFIPASHVGTRRYVFWLLAVYAASGMGLLLTTSFLGLRRYLRQRRIEMPTTMANLWLSTGAVLIVVLLVFAMLLPRPSAEYSVSQLPFSVGSPSQSSSRAAPVPREGTEEEQGGSAPDTRPPDEIDTTPKDQDSPNGQSGDDSKKQPAGQSGEAERQGSQSSDKGQRQQSGDQPDQSIKSDESSQQQQQDSRDAKSQKAEGERQSKSRSDSEKSPDDQRFERAEPNPENQSQDPDSSPRGEQRAPIETPNLQVPTEAVLTAASGIGQVVQWIFYGVVAVGVLYGLWRSWSAVLAGIREFLRGLAELWAALWGGGRRHAVRAEDAAAIEIPPAPFSSYADPFSAGVAQRYSLEELVRYSFEAFEAWAREHGCPRHPDQTPHELARDVSRLNAPMADDARNLAELYARAAYDRGELPASSPEQLEHLWRSMRSGAAPVFRKG